MDKNVDEIIALRNGVYEAMNLYLYHGRNPKLKKHYLLQYMKYRRAGGKHLLCELEQTIDEYNIQGHCGY